MALSSVFRSGWFSPLLRIVWPAMTDSSPSSRFKTDMPQIPGLTPSSKPPRRNPLLPLILGFTVVGVLILLSSHWLTHSHTAEPVRVEPPAQIEVPPPPPDPSASLPHADEKNPNGREHSRHNHPPPRRVRGFCLRLLCLFKEGPVRLLPA